MCNGRTVQRRALTVEVHVPGVVAALVLPNGLTDGADERDGQKAAKQNQDLEVGDALHVGQLQRGPRGVLGVQTTRHVNGAV